MINFEDFKKLELKVGKVIEAEKIENAEKLLKIKVDLGEEQRQIIAGIAKFYSAEELIGKQIIIVANLEPKTLMGLESQGMLLVAEDGERSALLMPDKEVRPGAAIR